MPNYRLVSNGYVADDISDAELNTLFTSIGYLRRDAYVDFALVVKGHVAVETLKIAKRLVGASFHDFLEANFNGGRGPMAPVVRSLIHFLNNKVGYFTVLTEIQVMENKLHADTLQREGVYTPTFTAGANEVFLRSGETVIDYDF